MSRQPLGDAERRLISERLPAFVDTSGGAVSLGVVLGLFASQTRRVWPIASVEMSLDHLADDHVSSVRCVNALPVSSAVRRAAPATMVAFPITERPSRVRAILQRRAALTRSRKDERPC